MGEFTLYAIKSAICLTMLYLPYMLLMQRDTFHAFNRGVLLAIVILSVMLPLFNIHVCDVSALSSLLMQSRQAIVEVGMPLAEGMGRNGGEVVADGAAAPSSAWAAWLVYIYIIGVVTCLVSRLVGFVRLHRFVHRGVLWTERVDGVSIYCHATDVSAMSWMNNVVVSDDDYRQHPAVMMHEMVHIHLRHSWDLLLIGIMEVVQWFNPCVWLLEWSMREVHEYEADAEVLSRGVTAQNYQMLLIRKAIDSSQYVFANGFNHNLIKKRFAMMMKQKSNRWSRIKALYLLPVAVVALTAFATPEFSSRAASFDGSLKVDDDRTMVYTDGGRKVTYILDGRRVTKEVYEAAEKEGEQVQKVTELNVEITIYSARTKRELLQSEEPDNEPDNDVVFEYCEVMPEFPGGTMELMKYMSSNLRYPEIAQKWGVQARVIISFEVSKEGDIRNVTLVRHAMDDNSKFAKGQSADDVTGISPEENGADAAEQVALACTAIEEEAMRVINNMPQWKPGMNRGKPVSVKFSVPISFRLR